MMIDTNLRYVGVIRILSLIKHLYLTGCVGFDEDQRTNTLKTHV